MDRYSENIDTIYQQFGEYFANDGSYSSLRAVIFYGVRWQSAVHENVQYSKTLVKNINVV